MSERHGVRRRVVLVVDDEPVVRAVLRLTLEDEGWVVIESGDAAAVEGVVAAAGGLDLLIVDLHLHGPSGTHVAVSLRATYPGLPVVVTSGSIDDLESAERQGSIPSPVHWLPKPFGPDVVLDAVRAVSGDAA